MKLFVFLILVSGLLVLGFIKSYDKETLKVPDIDYFVQKAKYPDECKFIEECSVTDKRGAFVHLDSLTDYSNVNFNCASGTQNGQLILCLSKIQERMKK